MSLVVCQDCTARYAPDLPQCPQCSSTRSVAEHGGPLLPFLDVACVTEGCHAVGVTRRVYLRAAAPGVVEWPSLVCATCGSRVCIERSWVDQTTTETEEDEMAKITVHGGPSNEATDEDPVAETELADTHEAGTELPAEPPVENPLPDAVDGDSTEQEAPTAYDTWTVERLRAELADRDLPTTGKKAELVKRLADADNPAAED